MFLAAAGNFQVATASFDFDLVHRKTILRHTYKDLQHISPEAVLGRHHLFVDVLGTLWKVDN